MTLTQWLSQSRGFRRAMLVINAVFLAGAVLALAVCVLAGAWLPVVVWFLVACGNAWAVASHLGALRNIRRNLACRA